MIPASAQSNHWARWTLSSTRLRLELRRLVEECLGQVTNRPDVTAQVFVYGERRNPAMIISSASMHNTMSLHFTHWWCPRNTAADDRH